jgi:gluconate 2-dehydrogenase gamma chain
MPGNGRLPRRRFLEVAASSAAVTAACGGPKSRWRFFSDAEATTLAAVCDQIIPPDQDPGASQGGVVEYIDRQLMGHFRRQKALYRESIQVLEGLAAERYGASFARLTPAQQLELLTDIDAKKAGDERLRSWFQAAVAHTMQGFYGSPRHGGNKNWASWRMVGVPASPVRGRLHYDRTRS